jgi:hypothetical protein
MMTMGRSSCGSTEHADLIQSRHEAVYGVRP